MDRKIKRYEHTNFVRNSKDYIGWDLILSHPMQAGKSQVKLDDSIWPVYAQDTIDLPVGSWVTVLKTNGVILVVQPKH